MTSLVIGNLGLTVFGGITMPRDFARYLLSIFITNLLLYTCFYIIMKLCHWERILMQHSLYIMLFCLACILREPVF